MKLQKENIYLGIGKLGFLQNERIYLQKHSWDCDWYWSFGYIGNKNLHTHFENEFLKEASIDKLFVLPQYSQDDWWIIRDLFIQVYALQACAEVYRYGGHQTTRKGITDIIKDEEMCKRLNSDLEKVLDKLWDFLQLNSITSTKD